MAYSNANTYPWCLTNVTKYLFETTATEDKWDHTLVNFDRQTKIKMEHYFTRFQGVWDPNALKVPSPYITSCVCVCCSLPAKRRQLRLNYILYKYMRRLIKHIPLFLSSFKAEKSTLFSISMVAIMEWSCTAAICSAVCLLTVKSLTIAPANNYNNIR